MVFDPTTARPVQQPAPDGGGFDISTAQPARQPDFPGAAVIEPARAVGSGIARAIGGGVAGIAGALTPGFPEGAGAEIVETTQAGAFQPTTEAGRAGLETLNTLIEKGIDIVNIPLSGVGGILELVSGQGVDQAVETIKAIQGRGISKTLGGRVFEETGDPLAATIAETAPEAVGAILGTKGAATVARGAQRGVATTGQALAPVAEAGREITKGVFQFQSPAKQRIARLLQEGATDVETAGLRLKQPSPVPGVAIPGQAPAGVPRLPSPSRTKLQEALDIGGPRVEPFPAAQETLKQGFDPGVIAPIQAANAATKAKMLKMADIMDRGKRNLLFGVRNRPGNVGGDSLLDRVKVIRTANKTAGKDIDRVSKGLQGQQVDIIDAITDFGESLDNLGVTLKPNGKGGFTPDFEVSVLAPGDRGPIKEVIRQMNIRGQGGVDALDVHKMKRIIDNNVTFGKKKTGGISRDAENVLKGFRVQLDEALDTKFPEYNQANIAYKETIEALNALQDAVGPKADLSGGLADQALGRALRKTMSNFQSRELIIEAIDQIEGVSKKHGGVFDDDLMMQALFADELDSMFGPAARTSFQGQIRQAVKDVPTSKAGIVDIGIDIAAKTAEKARGINQEGAFKAIKDLLRGQQ